MRDHTATTCEDVTCRPCLNEQRHESIIRLETALLGLETSREGADGAWADMQLIVDALDMRNVLDLLRD